jgi:hypothetical protein
VLKSDDKLGWADSRWVAATSLEVERSARLEIGWRIDGKKRETVGSDDTEMFAVTLEAHRSEVIVTVRWKTSHCACMRLLTSFSFSQLNGRIVVLL